MQKTLAALTAALFALLATGCGSVADRDAAAARAVRAMNQHGGPN